MNENDVKKLLSDIDVDYSVHNAWSSEHVFVGRTSRDLDVYIDREYIEAILRLLLVLLSLILGLVFSGGAKLILPVSPVFLLLMNIILVGFFMNVLRLVLLMVIFSERRLRMLQCLQKLIIL